MKDEAIVRGLRDMADNFLHDPQLLRRAATRIENMAKPPEETVLEEDLEKEIMECDLDHKKCYALVKRLQKKIATQVPRRTPFDSLGPSHIDQLTALREAVATHSDRETFKAIHADYHKRIEPQRS